MQDVMNVIIAWLSVTTSLPATDTRPFVTQLSAHKIAAIHYGGEFADGRDDVVAIYIPTSQTIVLRNDWDSRRPADVSALVHELVHHLQNASGRNYVCQEAKEAEAYAAQQLWLAQFDMSLESEFGIDDFSLAMKTSCMLF